MTTLDELERLAMAATPGPWVIEANSEEGKHEYWGYWHRAGPLLLTGASASDDSTYIAAIDPQTLLRLIKVVREAQDWLIEFPTENHALCSLASALHELECAAPKATMPEWQPIETAPKDGTRIVLSYSYPSDNGYGIIHGRWDIDRFAKRPKPYWTNDLENMYGVRRLRDNSPTHWMPLPAAPTPEEGKG